MSEYRGFRRRKIERNKDKKTLAKNVVSVGDRFRYFTLYKPYGVLNQFSDSSGRKTLADFCKLPRDVYPVGRLDFDTEGLVLLTNDGRLKNILLDPKNKHPRTYLVQVENVPNKEALEKLCSGVLLKDYRTLPAEAELLESPPHIPPRDVPIRFRKNIPTAWLKITLHEGKNRQVRRMTAVVGYPTLRLVRISIGPLNLEKMQPGEMHEMSESESVILKKLLERI